MLCFQCPWGFAWCLVPGQLLRHLHQLRRTKHDKIDLKNVFARRLV